MKPQRSEAGERKPEVGRLASGTDADPCSVPRIISPADRSAGGYSFPGFSLLTSTIVVLLLGCSYSFKGGSVPPHLSSIAIPLVEDASPFGDPALREMFTRQLVDRFQSDNTLQLTDRNAADAVLEGVITDVKDAPNVLEKGEQVSGRRITVTVRMVFQDLKLRKTVWEKNFTQHGDYPSGGGLTQQNEGIVEAVRKLTEDILNETVAGW